MVAEVASHHFQCLRTWYRLLLCARVMGRAWDGYPEIEDVQSDLAFAMPDLMDAGTLQVKVVVVIVAIVQLTNYTEQHTLPRLPVCFSL
jgi:hypothetical protein